MVNLCAWSAHPVYTIEVCNWCLCLYLIYQCTQSKIVFFIRSCRSMFVIACTSTIHGLFRSYQSCTSSTEHIGHVNCHRTSYSSHTWHLVEGVCMWFIHKTSKYKIGTCTSTVHQLLWYRWMCTSTKYITQVKCHRTSSSPCNKDKGKCRASLSA